MGNEDVEISKLVTETAGLARTLIKFERIITETKEQLDSRVKKEATKAVEGIQKLLASWTSIEDCGTNLYRQILSDASGVVGQIQKVAFDINRMNSRDKMMDMTELSFKPNGFLQSLQPFRNAKLGNERMAQAIMQGMVEAGASKPAVQDVCRIK